MSHLTFVFEFKGQDDVLFLIFISTVVIAILALRGCILIFQITVQTKHTTRRWQHIIDEIIQLQGLDGWAVSTTLAVLAILILSPILGLIILITN